MLLNTANFQILTTGFQTAFDGAFNDYTPTVLWPKFCTDTTSTTAQELYPWLGRNTGFREWNGDRKIQNIPVQGYAIVNKQFENTIGVKRTAIADDLYGVYTPMFRQLGQDTAEHPDVLVFSALQQADTLLCYDGKPFFSNAHPGVDAKGKATTYSNDMGGNGASWYLLCTTRVMKPMILQKREDYQMRAMVDLDNPKVFLSDEFTFGVDGRSNVGFGMWQCAVRSKQPLTPANYEAARIAMMSFLRDNGQPWNLMPDTLLVGPSLQGAANTIAKAQLVATAAGTATQTNIWEGTIDPLVSPRITW